ncbi:MAG: phage capsid protein [Planctomycetota bacterium]|jgi:hypothetical protein
MSFQITTAFVEQYKNNVQMLVQQKGSRLRDTVNTMQVTGRNAFVEQIGSTTPVLRTSRHGDSPLISTPHSRRRLSLADYEWGDLVDKPDMVRTLIDPTNAYSMNAAWAFGRQIDDVIITAASATAQTGQTGTGTADMDTANRVAVDYVESGSATDSNLTVGKLRRAKAILDGFDVDEDEQRHIVVSASQIQALLRDDEVTSADFNTVRALVNGEINTYMGFTFHRTQRLTISATNVRTCLAYVPSAMTLGIGEDVMARIQERPDKAFSTYVFYRMSIGAVRLEEEKVVEISADEDL